jgi:5-methylcytosine-specific restriction protein A
MPKRMEFFQPASKPKARRNRPNSYRRGYGGKAWDIVRREVLVRDNYECRRCGRVCQDAHVDHIIPKRILNSNDPKHLQTLCPPCHAKKTAEEQHGIHERP